MGQGVPCCLHGDVVSWLQGSGESLEGWSLSRHSGVALDLPAGADGYLAEITMEVESDETHPSSLIVGVGDRWANDNYGSVLLKQPGQS